MESQARVPARRKTWPVPSQRAGIGALRADGASVSSCEDLAKCTGLSAVVLFFAGGRNTLSVHEPEGLGLKLHKAFTPSPALKFLLEFQVSCSGNWILSFVSFYF